MNSDLQLAWTRSVPRRRIARVPRPRSCSLASGVSPFTQQIVGRPQLWSDLPLPDRSLSDHFGVWIDLAAV